MRELIHKTNIDFMGKKYIAFAISGVLTLLGLFAMVQVGRGAANLGIDFAGGTAVQIKFEKQISLDNIRGLISGAGLKDVELQELPTENKILIMVKKEEERLGGFSDKIVGVLEKGFPGNRITVDSVSEIGPKVGKKLRVDALWAVLASAAGILVYVGWRFQFRFSVGATVATFHDVFAVLGIFYLMGREINLILVTALLTIAGYSLTDTVVVFDRIRENMRFALKEPVEKVINRSINEVLSRTIVTSLTVFLSSLALFFVGGEVLHDFALAMLMGIIIGTYSSVFVASPVVLLWGGSSKPLVKK
jgi:preprotein translocase subunit SecF